MNLELLERARRLGLTNDLQTRLEEADYLNRTERYDTALRRWLVYRIRHGLSVENATRAAEAHARNIQEQRTRRLSHETGAT